MQGIYFQIGIFVLYANVCTLIVYACCFYLFQKRAKSYLESEVLDFTIDQVMVVVYVYVIKL